jgi:hypothetical protein
MASSSSRFGKATNARIALSDAQSASGSSVRFTPE